MKLDPQELESFPDREWNITDNVSAISFLESIRILDSFKEVKPLPFGGNVQMLLCTISPNHWIVCFRFHGFDKDENNGFAVRIMPKSKYSESDANDLMREFSRKSGGVTIDDNLSNQSNN
ncbi:hypothetical protein SH580_14055 [Coraliomargarita algicola]|uniref:Uncharacterized protein n=1 Tax=Coraliomargarita algicola TaxID=3092156 RepID=A0ABZ0RH33_9BACT|nr:hypothetical protein [Coraliomargarita sp. J2-16]WPJ94554.1 hypothetical protein SH580_14055 [Coraliomargarita sp. J2-16]